MPDSSVCHKDNAMLDVRKQGTAFYTQTGAPAGLVPLLSHFHR